MNYPSIKFILRTNYINALGQRMVCLRYTQNRKSHLISLKLPVTEECWDKKNLRFKRNHPDHFHNNLEMDDLERRAREIIFNYKIKSKRITFDIFIKALFNNSSSSESFIDYFEKHLELNKEILAKNTLKDYKSELTKFKSFRNNVIFEEIDARFLNSY